LMKRQLHTDEITINDTNSYRTLCPDNISRIKRHQEH